MTGTMQGTVRPTINLGNSIVGVGILAMPWCFKECGVILGILLLVASGLMATWSCKMLVRAAYMKSKMSYETLGHVVYGRHGKMLVELSTIGLNIGACVAFFVIIGDLAPPIVAQATGVKWSPGFLRAFVMVTLAVCVALPLSLLRNVDNLSAISVCSLLFYSSLIVQLVVLSYTNFSTGTWWHNVTLWNWGGAVKCLPIFSLAFGCHTQLFVMYSALVDPTVRKMSTVIDGAVIMVGLGYSLVAFFGYVAFCTDSIQGDVLSNFPLNLLSQVTRFGFAVSVVVSFPLLIFPCRGSINSLVFSKTPMELHVSEPIPPKRFNFITTSIIALTLTIAIIIPQVETILALTGSTMGALISYIFPGSILLQVTGAKAEFSKRAKLLLCLGFCIMIVSTAVTISSHRQQTNIDTVPHSYGLHDGVKQFPVTGGGKFLSEPLLDKGVQAMGEGGEEGGRKEEEPPQTEVEVRGEEDRKELEGESERAVLRENLVKEILDVKDRLKQMEAENEDLKAKQEVLENQQMVEAVKHQQLEEALEKGSEKEGDKEDRVGAEPSSRGGQKDARAVTEGDAPSNPEKAEDTEVHLLEREVTGLEKGALEEVHLPKKEVAGLEEGVREDTEAHLPEEAGLEEGGPMVARPREVEHSDREVGLEDLPELNELELPDRVAPQILQVAKEDEEKFVAKAEPLGDVQSNIGEDRKFNSRDLKALPLGQG